MPALLRDETRPPNFELKTVSNRTFRLSDVLRKQRVVLLFPSGSDAAAYTQMLRWLDTATRQPIEFERRDMTVLVMSQYLLPHSKPFPASFVELLDPKSSVAAKYGGAPAFYLVGKDGGIKRASRRCPAVADLFRQIDAMPMRRQEMRDQSGN